MTRNRISSLLLAAIFLLFLAQPAAAFEYWKTCRGGVTWDTYNVPFQPELASFPWYSPEFYSIDAARLAWNNSAPGTNYRIHYNWVQSAYTSTSDGINSILVPTQSQWSARVSEPDYIAVTLGRWSTCYPTPGPRMQIREMDILFNPSLAWDPSTNPQPPLNAPPYNMTITAVHEHGHALGLWHEDDLVTRMNSIYPLGGEIGTRNDPHPYGDDARGARNAYGTALTARDIGAYAYRSLGGGWVRELIPPGNVPRNSSEYFDFAVDNRGTTDETIRVHFYLTPDRSVSTGHYLGAADVTLQYARQIQARVLLPIPANAPTGFQYFAWVTDPHNSISEVDEGNNAVAHIYMTHIGQNRVPDACFERDPVVGNAPMTVTVDASCSSDHDGEALTYTWDFGDGSPLQTGVTTSHTYYMAGYHNITLTVTDPSGASRSTLQTVVVQCSLNSPACQEPL